MIDLMLDAVETVLVVEVFRRRDPSSDPPSLSPPLTIEICLDNSRRVKQRILDGTLDKSVK